VSTADRLSRTPPWLVVAALVCATALVGLAVTRDPRYGAVAIGALVFAAFVVLDLPVAVGLWCVALYLAGVSGTQGAPTGTTVLLVAGCLGTLADRGDHLRRSLPQVRAAYLSAALLLAWSAATAVWAVDAGTVRQETWYFALAAVALPIVVTSCTTSRDVLVVATAFVLGATCAIAAGVLLGTSDAPADPLAAAEAAAGRLHVGLTDPNYLAADIVAALAIVTGLLGVSALRRWRPWLVLTIPVLLYGLVATQSRGGFIAAVAAAALAALHLREHRARVVGGLAVAVVLLGLFLATQPRAVERLTQDDATGTGRTEIWKIATAVARDHPLGGVGTGNFRLVEGGYVDRVGPIADPSMFVDTPLVTHDIWLQAFAEQGLPGLLIQLAVIATCIGASFRAARRYRRDGRPDLATFARALAVGQLSSVVASTFIANGNDRVFWILLALGPALLAVATVGRDAGPRDAGPRDAANRAGGDAGAARAPDARLSRA
jgi:O-antigen ligase